MEKRVNKFIYWIPRILTIAFLLFLTIFSFDVFDSGAGFWEVALGLFMHNIPVFVLLIVLLISWKWEIIGGVIFLLVGILFVVRILMIILTNEFKWDGLSQLILAGPALLIGVLFIINWFQARQK